MKAKKKIAKRSPRKKGVGQGKGGGRPTDHQPDKYPEMAKQHCLLGAIDTELADLFGVSVATINTWKVKYPKFLESIKEGKASADARVANSLYHRALGYSHPEDKVFCQNSEVTVVPTTKHYPPDATSAIFWLKNRQRDKWRDKHEIEHGGGIKTGMDKFFERMAAGTGKLTGGESGEQ